MSDGVLRFNEEISVNVSVDSANEQLKIVAGQQVNLISVEAGQVLTATLASASTIDTSCQLQNTFELGVKIQIDQNGSPGAIAADKVLFGCENPRGKIQSKLDGPNLGRCFSGFSKLNDPKAKISFSVSPSTSDQNIVQKFFEDLRGEIVPSLTDQCVQDNCIIDKLNSQHVINFDAPSLPGVDTINFSLIGSVSQSVIACKPDSFCQLSGTCADCSWQVSFVLTRIPLPPGFVSASCDERV